MVALRRPRPRIVPRVRVAGPADLGELRRLLATSGHVAAPSRARFGARKHLLVIDAPDGATLAAVAQLVIEGRAARIAFVAVDPRYVHLGFGDHLLRFAGTIARGFGVRSLCTSC